MPSWKILAIRKYSEGSRYGKYINRIDIFTEFDRESADILQETGYRRPWSQKYFYNNFKVLEKRARDDSI